MLRDFRAYQVAKEFYQVCKTVRVDQRMKEQLLRASSSIALNLAESAGERTSKERTRYFVIALGSLRECQAILDLEGIKRPDVISPADELGRILYRLCDLPRSKLKATTQLPLLPQKPPLTSDHRDGSPELYPLRTGELGA